MRAVRSAADPDLFVPQSELCAGVPHERIVDVADGANGYIAANFDSLPHRFDIACNETCIRGSLVAQLCKGDVADARGEALDLRARRGFASEKEGGQVESARGLRLVETRDSRFHFCKPSFDFRRKRNRASGYRERNGSFVGRQYSAPAALWDEGELFGVAVPRAGFIGDGRPHFGSPLTCFDAGMAMLIEANNILLQ